MIAKRRVPSIAAQAVSRSDLAKMSRLLQQTSHHHLPKIPVALEMPFAAHGGAAGVVPLGIEQDPAPASCRFGAGPGVVLRKAALEIHRPSDIGPMEPPVGAAEDVDVAGHFDAQ